MILRIRARGVDPTTGEADPHGVPQIACPARQGDVNPQFTCRSCPCAAGVETHQAVDDLGQPFRIVEAVDCTFEGEGRILPAVWCAFPSLLAGKEVPAPARLEPGVACPRLASPERFVAVSLLVEGVRWTPVPHCRDCQFHRGNQGVPTTCSPGAGAGIAVLCAAPLGGRHGR